MRKANDVDDDKEPSWFRFVLASCNIINAQDRRLPRRRRGEKSCVRIGEGDLLRAGRTRRGKGGGGSGRTDDGGLCQTWQTYLSFQFVQQPTAAQRPNKLQNACTVSSTRATKKARQSCCCCCTEGKPASHRSHCVQYMYRQLVMLKEVWHKPIVLTHSLTLSGVYMVCRWPLQSLYAAIIN